MGVSTQTTIRLLPEWCVSQTVWTAWPFSRDAWGDQLERAQREFAEFIYALGGDSSATVDILVHPNGDADTELGRFDTNRVCVHRAVYGDIWLRDTGPVFATASGALAALRFGFNGWGGKYFYDGDEAVATTIADLTGVEMVDVPLTAEGGAFETNGAGTLVTTKSALLNSNRNPGRSVAEVEALLCASFGVESVLWLDEGLNNDHTDGHVDNVLRFVNEETCVCMKPSGSDDPNYDRLIAVRRAVGEFRDACGRSFEIVEVPSPGAVFDQDGTLLPASYLNYCLTNERVIVPTYSCPSDQDAVRALGQCFATREAVGVPAAAILTGGGAFHCITLQQPKFVDDVDGEFGEH